jgi:6-oxo-cyclohex-1-ene-carbonyl-CoA hydrolase
MLRKNYLSKVVPVLKVGDKFIPNPQVITDKWVDNGQIVYGENATGEAAQKAREIIKSAKTDLSMLDAEVNRILWTFTNLFPGCLIKSVEGIRLKKKFFWDQAKVINRHWLAANMATEAYLGFNAFNTKKITGKDTIDFIEYRRRIAGSSAFDAEFMAAVLGKPKS